MLGGVWLLSGSSGNRPCGYQCCAGCLLCGEALSPLPPPGIAVSSVGWHEHDGHLGHPCGGLHVNTMVIFPVERLGISQVAASTEWVPVELFQRNCQAFPPNHLGHFTLAGMGVWPLHLLMVSVFTVLATGSPERCGSRFRPTSVTVTLFPMVIEGLFLLPWLPVVGVGRSSGHVQT